MGKCYFCEKANTTICGMCETSICDEHKHPVNRWHNVYHARWICQSCYKQRQKKKKYVLVPMLTLFALILYSTMNVQLGLKEPSLWNFLLAVVSVPAGVLGFSGLYHLITLSGQSRKHLILFLPFLLLWIIIYLIAISFS